MSAEVEGLGAEAYDRMYSDAELLRRILRYFRQQRKYFLQIIIALGLIVVGDLSQPLIISFGVNLVAGNRALSILALVAGSTYAATVGSWGANLIRRRATSQAIGNIVQQMRVDAFESAVSRDLSFYDEFPSGKIVSRITSDTQDFAQMIVLVTDLISQMLVLILLVVILFFTEWHLALMLMLMVPLVLGSALLFRHFSRQVSRQASRMLANVNGTIQESIAGISIAKNFRQEHAIYADFTAINYRSYKVNLRRGLILGLIFPTLNLLSGLGNGALLYFGAQSVLAGAISAGAWFLFLQSVYRFWDPLSNVASFWSQFQAGLASAERIFALIDAPIAVVQTADLPVGEALRGEIVFEHVRFQYGTKEVVLPDFDLHIAPGETIAFVGHTGAGKSSLAKLVARFYEFQGGRLSIDGRDIRTLNLAQYRRHLGIVSQTPFLFNGTVLDNIRYARPAASDDDIQRIVYSIGEGEWVETLPHGLLTDVGERGSRLSMGQRQLVALTRVLVQAPSIFILDEATASVDPFTEAQIQEALNLILARSTSILIAHRLSTIKAADRIIVLKKGQIIEEGNHDWLMQHGGHYADLYNTYFRHQSLDFVNSALHERPVLVGNSPYAVE